MAEAAVAHRPKVDQRPKAGLKPAEAGTGHAAGVPAFLGGVARPAGAPQFLQRQPFTPHDLVEEEEIEEGVLQRMPQDPVPAADEDDEEDPSLAQIQAKLEVNRPGDAFERQADHVAEAVSRPGAQHAAAGPAPGRPAAVQRACPDCGGEHDDDGGGLCPDCASKAALQRKADVGDAPRPGASAADAVARPGAGAPLDLGVRERVEPEVGRDLSHVRVHSDRRANEAASSIDARAFTHGDHIWLGPGQSGSDLALMAHEATHTVQQREATGSRPALIQRAPSDHRHPEDGAGPRSRMNAAVDEEIGDVDPPEPGEPKPDFDPAEKSAKAGGLEGKARPDVDRPAAEAPKVEQAAAVVEAEADQPGEPIAEGEAGASGAAPEAAAEGAGAELNAAQAAMAQAATLPVPPEPQPLATPEIVAPVNADGEPMAPDVEAEARVQILAGQFQAARQGAHAMRLKARQERANATLLRGNIALVDGHVAEAETGLAEADNQLEYRREVITESENALGTSEEKAERVSAEAPDFEAEADEAEGESGPMASEASATSAENAANTPDDPEAAAEAREQGGQMDQVSGDAASMDQAASATKARAVELQADAAEASSKNAETRGRIDEAASAADATGERIGQMTREAETARGQVDAVKERPAEIEAEAQRLDAGAEDIAARMEASSAELDEIQAAFRRDAGNVIGSQTLAEENEGSIQRQEAPAGGAPAREREYAPRGYEGRRSVDLRTSLLGPPELTEEQREKQQAEEERARERRRSRITALEEKYGSDLGELGMLDRAGIALGFMRDDLFGSISDIKWPDWSLEGAGDALIKAFNPKVPLEGVLSGLSKVASGTLNLFDPEQWARDPLGNLLKSAADIATGITVVLGSIVALAGMVMAIMAALIVVTLGWASPVALPVITFCGNVTITVGGWTISVGLLALYYQSLLFIKNLVDAMTAETAEELVVESEQMTEDTKQAGEIAMQVGTAAVGRMGGAGMMDEIAGIGAAGTSGGSAAMRQAATVYAGKETLQGMGDAAAEGLLGEEWGQLYGIARMGQAVHGARRGRGGEAEGGGGPRPDAEAGGGTRPEAEASAARPAEAEGGRTPEVPDQPAAPPPEAPAAEAVAAPRPLEPETPAARPQPGAAAEPPRPSRDMDTSRQPEPEARSVDEADAAPEAGGETAPGAAGTTRPTPTPEGPAPSTETTTRPADVPRIDEGPGAAARPDAADSPGRRAEEAADPDAARSRAEEATEGTEGTGRRDTAEDGGRDPARDAELRQEAARKSGEDLSRDERAAEAAQLAETPPRPVENEGLQDLGFDQKRRLDNDMEYISSKERNAACRVANTSCGDGDGTDPDTEMSGNDLAEEVDAALAQDGDTSGDGASGRAPSVEEAGRTPPQGPDEARRRGEAEPAEERVEGSQKRDSGEPAEAGETAPASAPSTQTGGLPPRTGDLRADAKAMDGRPADVETTARMEEMGYTPVRSVDGDIIAYRRPGGESSDLPAVRVSEGRIRDVDHRVPPPPGSEPIRVASDGEHWIENKDGTFRPVSAMADPARAGGDNGRRHNPQVGRWGEVQADKFAESRGWKKLNGEPTQMADPFTGPQRLDAVYINENPPPGPLVVGDAKALDSPQTEPRSGKQLSDQWIQDRVGASDLPPEIQRKIEAGDYDAVFLRVDKYGNVHLEHVDKDGNPTVSPQGGGNTDTGGGDE